jgi:tetratricopeptide (TPR) repeat protein
MIVKDEAHCIEQCIKSVASIVDEIIVADTGSKDGTGDIARQHGAQVFDFTWIDDFAAARNATISRATKEWILILDADEVIAESDLTALKNLTNNRLICSEFLQRHYTNDVRLSDFSPCRGEFPELEKQYAGYFESNCVRLFPHRDGLEYRNRIHELVEPSIYELKKHQIQRTPIRIHHYGHTPEVQALKKKGLLYTPLGQKKTSDDPTDWKAFYELGVERNVNAKSISDREESVKAFYRSIELNPHYVPTWTNLGYVLMEMGRFEESLTAFKEALKREPQNSDAYCNIGVIGLRTGDLKLAERATLSAIQINPKYVNALRNLVKIYSQSNRMSEAALVCRYILSLIPKYAPALADLGALYLQQRDFTVCEKYLLQSHALEEKNVETLYNLGQMYRLQQKFTESKTYFSKILSVAPEFVLPPEVKAFIGSM